MPGKDAVDVLKAVPLFSELSGGELKRVAKETREELYSAGQDLVTQGQAGGPFFVLTEGAADILIDDEKIGSLVAGDHFGEMALLNDGKRTATVRASGQVKALAITSWNFLGILADNWDITKKILAELSDRVASLES